jgi:hypothetical protein
MKTVEAPPPPPAADPQARDVRAILQNNLKNEKDCPVNSAVYAPKKKFTRRLRDYLLIMIGANLAIVITVLVLPLNVISLIYGLSGIVMLSIGTTWIMFQVMDDY